VLVEIWCCQKYDAPTPIVIYVQNRMERETRGGAVRSRVRFPMVSLEFFIDIILSVADPSDRVVEGVGLLPLACWDCGFESRRGHGCLSLMSVVCCQEEVSATGWSLFQRSPTECGVSEVCDSETSKNEEA
jgi:hypothetical protein